jgi:alpha-ketoglutarate-dependent taurine dioxygenase
MSNSLSRLLHTRAENIITTSRVHFSFPTEDPGFPLMISPKSYGLLLTEWINGNKDLFKDKLKERGAILFRGFEINTVEKFQNCMGVFDAAPLEYRQRSSPRFEVAKNVYHSTTYPADQSINMHCENSYALNWPMKIVFCCIKPADEQGETPIADTRMVVRNLSQPTKEKFLNKGIKYVRSISGELGLSWEEVFQTNDKDEVEKECLELGMKFKWEKDGRLILSWKNKAIYNHPDTNEQVWFNHAFFFNKYALPEEVLSTFNSDDELPFNTFFGDGSEIAKEEIEEIRMAYERSSVTFPWEKGDVLFMDNMLMAHGRSPYTGDREIIVSMF